MQRELQNTSEKRRRDWVDSLARDFHAGRNVTDFRFDPIYPLDVRKHSHIHWTPVEVAILAAKLLGGNERTKVLDVGSGCGKFCTVAALATPSQFFGIEQRPRLNQVAREVSEEFGAINVSFIQGDMTDLDWNSYDAFYLFNPFSENRQGNDRIDDSLPMGEEKFKRCLETVRAKLRMLRHGTKVVTYHGLGGDFPFGYHQIKRIPIGTSCVELWVKLEGFGPTLKIVGEN